MTKLKSLSVAAALSFLMAGSAYAVDVTIIVQNKNTTSAAIRLTDSAHSIALAGTTFSPARTDNIAANTTASPATAHNSGFPNNQALTEYYQTSGATGMTCKFTTSYLIINNAPQYTYKATKTDGSVSSNCTATLTTFNQAANSYTVTYSIK